jgi:hypothetical protein
MKKFILSAFVLVLFFPAADAMNLSQGFIQEAQKLAQQPIIHLHIGDTARSSWRLISPKMVFYTAAIGGIYYASKRWGPLRLIKKALSYAYSYAEGVVSLPLITMDVPIIKKNVEGIKAVAEEIQGAVKETRKLIAEDHLTILGISAATKKLADEQEKSSKALLETLDSINKGLDEKISDIASKCGILPDILEKLNNTAREIVSLNLKLDEQNRLLKRQTALLETAITKTKRRKAFKVRKRVNI